MTATLTPRQRAEALVPDLAARAAEAEAQRRMPDATFAAIKSAGLHRMSQPRRFGGLEQSQDETAEVIRTLARGCGSAAWVCSVYNDHAILVEKMDPRAADEVWRENPDATISAGYFPSGTAERVQGGWKLAGTWGFASGVDHAGT